ncbi:BPTI/Kunitz domain-containing protein-like [Stylophora pistillata]|uniref:BPTI/Kunitz domain-containing protein-like n=1 Tax=Stylophora pistillata TaxID=50429 RepID=UPI000C04934D|nr:BPTI/Kunitz domain-containing protein-like [Stylophora pistillata]
MKLAGIIATYTFIVFFFADLKAAKDCSSLDEVCRLRKKPGPCWAFVVRYFFDTNTGKCKPFIYGGCLGNKKNFRSLQACQVKCPDLKAAKDRSSLDEVCRLPEKPGPCRAAFPRFFFDKNTGQCRQFIYGGCQGNKNNFRSLQACQWKCPDQQVAKDCSDLAEVCCLHEDPGPCRAAFPRFFFNKNTGKCQQFIYGGCEGNKNNFRSLQACQMKCQNSKCVT